MHWALGAVILIIGIIGVIAGWALCLRCCTWQAQDLEQESRCLRYYLTLLVQGHELGSLSERLWEQAGKALER